MRIIGGKYGGRRINPPSRMPHTRPTTDVAKEGLFNVLQNELSFEGIKTLDLFGGTGCISYELASRGAGDLSVVEKDAKQARFIRQTAKALGIENLKVYQMDVFKYIGQSNEQRDLIFAGPPYSLPTIDRLPDLIFDRNLLKPSGGFILEHTNAHYFDDHPHFYKKKNYGTTIFSIFIHPVKPLRS